jgi:hypothetical protein
MTDRKHSMAKRARELEQKSAVRERDQRHADRKVRLAERVAAGVVGAPIEADPPAVVTPELPFLDEV